METSVLRGPTDDRRPVERGTEQAGIATGSQRAAAPAAAPGGKAPGADAPGADAPGGKAPGADAMGADAMGAENPGAAEVPGAGQEAAARLQAIIDGIAQAHRPSDMPFFQRLGALPPQIATDPRLLGELHLVYQAAMHATRAAVYFLPHLDSPAMRKRKLQIFIDDDGLPGGDTHHYQLTRAFRNMGAACPLDDEAFGSAEELVGHLDSRTAAFVHLTKVLYARSLGPWCIVETMSDDWMHALATALARHFPRIVEEPYFADCFDQGVEERHAAEAIAVTQEVLARRPDLLDQTIADAKAMADALDGVWIAMDGVLSAAIARHENPGLSG